MFLNRFSVLMLKIILKNKKILFNTFSNKKNTLKIITTILTNTPNFSPKNYLSDNQLLPFSIINK